MVVDINFLIEIKDATRNRLYETRMNIKRLNNLVTSLNKSSWDDLQREKFQNHINDTNTKLEKSIIELENYLNYLEHKINDLVGK